ncbi:hypothetical protein D3C84_764160 [compost metagenome]
MITSTVDHDFQRGVADALVALEGRLAHLRFEQLVEHVIPLTGRQLAQGFQVELRPADIAIAAGIET